MIKYIKPSNDKKYSNSFILRLFAELLLGSFSVSCGYRPSGMRIVGGSVAPINSWPWQAMLRNSYGSQFCGGSLIHPLWVVTATHCVQGKSASSVKVV